MKDYVWCNLNPNNPLDVERFRNVLEGKPDKCDEIEMRKDPNPYIARIIITKDWEGGPEDAKTMIDDVSETDVDEYDKRILNPNNTYSMDEFKRRKTLLDSIHAPKLEKVRADELRVGDFVAFPRVKDGTSTVATTEGKARLLGYFLAEGSFNKSKGKRTTVVFSFSMAEKNTFVAEVIHLLGQEFPGKNKPWVQDRVDRNVCVVHLTNRKAADWFYEHGGEYSHGKRLSCDAMNWSMENHKHLIGTWINGDGFQAKQHGGFLSGTTVSYDTVNQIHVTCLHIGRFFGHDTQVNVPFASIKIAQGFHVSFQGAR